MASLTPAGAALDAAPRGWRAWWWAARPGTLAVGAAPVGVGTALAAAAGSFRALPALAALAGALLIQVGTNLANDVFDHERGADDETRVGPARAVQQGWLAATQVRRAALGVFAAAALVGLYLVAVGGWPILWLGVASIGAGLAYTAGPWPLGYHGLGDLAVFLFFGVAAVCGSYYVQALGLTPAVVAASLPIGALATAVLVVNNVRDLESDRRAGKRTLAVRLGERAARREYAGLVLGAYALLPLPACLAGDALAALLPLATLPAALGLIRRVAAQQGAALNPALAGTARLELAFAAALAAGWLA